jgi:hypothetical protein
MTNPLRRVFLFLNKYVILNYFKEYSMSAKNIASLNNNSPALAPASRGAGPAGTTAVATAAVVKDVVLPAETAIVQPVHNGGYVAPPATAIPPSTGVNPYGK